jgi:hydroxyacylglutathione hydrolase
MKGAIMGLIFESFFADGISQLSYLVGDDSNGTAVVIDPRPDVDVYLQAARKREVSITRVFETHIHADFMSGSRELSERTGDAKIHCSHEGGAEYGFEHEAIHCGDEFVLGGNLIKVQHTPGHTPEHIALVLSEKDRPQSPWGVVTGDSLFVGSAGRPDLLGDENTDLLTENLFHTLRDFYLTLNDGVIVLPCHGAGSACGADIGDRPISTIGYERRHNPFLQIDDFAEFREFVQEGAPPVPAHYPRLKKVNAAGPPLIGHIPACPGLPVQEFREQAERDTTQVLDVRSMHAFGGGHVPGAINIGGNRPELSVWAGDILDPERPILLVLDEDYELPRILVLLWRTGFTQFAGYLIGGMKMWQNAGLPLDQVPQMSVHALKGDSNVQRLDVRSDKEWQEGHIPAAVHEYVGTLRGRAVALDRTRPVATYCASGYRASLAASLLQRAGFEDVRNVPGSWKAWTNAGYPVENGE